jgi:hypothetical protein
LQQKQQQQQQQQTQKRGVKTIDFAGSKETVYGRELSFWKLLKHEKTF